MHVEWGYYTEAHIKVAATIQVYSCFPACVAVSLALMPGAAPPGPDVTPAPAASDVVVARTAAVSLRSATAGAIDAAARIEAEPVRSATDGADSDAHDAAAFASMVPSATAGAAVKRR